MTAEKQHFGDDQPTDEGRITIELPPELRKQIRAAAHKKGLPLDEYLRLVLEEAVLDQERAERDQEAIPSDILEQLARVRQQTLLDNKGKLFEDTTEIIRQQREERSQYLEQLHRIVGSKEDRDEKYRSR
jgi:hypothetical protein